MTAFNSLKQELEYYLSNEQIEQIYQAYQFAAMAHQGQQRQSGDPYITHPLAVATILAQMRMDTATIIAALLHDVIEDTRIKKSALKVAFNSEIAELVDGMSKLTHITSLSRAEVQAENFRKMLLAMAQDIRVIIIKLVDRLHNMRTLDQLSSEKRQRIANETLDIYAPIARRLSMHNVQIELEDLCFANLYPLRYRVLQAAVQRAKQKHKSLITQIELALKSWLEKHNLFPNAVRYRPKHLYQLYKNMQKYHLPLNEALDVPTYCIIVDNIDACYRILGAVHALYKPILEHFRDYIALPKTNGYQALHTTLFGPDSISVNIQIRTLEMDNCANNGIAGHWAENAAILIEKWSTCAWLKHLLDIQKISPGAIEFIESVKSDLFPTGIYLFTPKGDIIELPIGATPIDFAYAIHSDIGNHCTAARIDKRLMPLSTPLLTGQTVEILIEPTTHPEPNWLSFVVTGRARSHIRHYLKQQQQSAAVVFGQHLIDSILASLNTDWSKLPTASITAVLDNLHYANEEQLLEAIGFGYLLPRDIVDLLLRYTPSIKTKTVIAQPLPIKGPDDVLMLFAECCRPIPNDEVLGILQTGRGMVVHLRRCKYTMRILRRSPERLVPLCWEQDLKAYFKTDLRIEAINQIGVLAQVINKITEVHANIDNIKTEARSREYGMLYLTISVHSRKHLAKVLRLLRSLNTLLKISRGN